MAGLIAGTTTARGAVAERAGLDLPGHGARRADRLAQGRRRPTAARTSRRSSPRSTGWSSTRTTRPEHPRAQPLVRHEPPQSYTLDPLAYAAEQAWKHGHRRRRRGRQRRLPAERGRPRSRTRPIDPYVIAVGALRHRRARPTTRDDSVAPFSAGAEAGGTAQLDFVAPGAHIQGLRVPNSLHRRRTIRRAPVRPRTSAAAARPSRRRSPPARPRSCSRSTRTLTPDQVKKMLRTRATPIKGNAQRRRRRAPARPGAAALARPAGGRRGRLDGHGLARASRGTDHLTRDGVVLTGEQDIFGQPVRRRRSRALEAAGSSWSGGAWNGSELERQLLVGELVVGKLVVGQHWSGSSWSAANWSGNSWSGSSWSGTAGRATPGPGARGPAAAGQASPGARSEAVPLVKRTAGIWLLAAAAAGTAVVVLLRPVTCPCRCARWPSPGGRSRSASSSPSARSSTCTSAARRTRCR